MDNLSIDNIETTENLIKGLSENINHTPRSVTIDADMTMYLRLMTDTQVVEIIGRLNMLNQHMMD